MAASATLQQSVNPGLQRYVVVVGMEPDEAGGRALDEAIALALGRAGGELHVVRVLNDVPLGQQPAKLDAASSELHALLAEYRTRDPRLDAVGLYFHARLGAPAQAIAQLAADVDADLIVVGLHDRDRIAKLTNALHKSVSDALFANAHCPVMVVRPKNYASDAATPTIEPPCPDCVQARFASRGQTFWCPRHSIKHAQGHSYAYRAEIPFRTHDSEVTPTGIDPSRVY